MRYFLLAGLAVISMAIQPAIAAKAPRVPTVKQLAAFPKMSHFEISPDGKHLVALEGRGEERVILVWDADNLQKTPTTIGSTKMKISSVEFVKDDVLGVFLWQPYDLKFGKIEKNFVYKFFLTDLKGKKWKEPLQQPRPRSDVEERVQAAITPEIVSYMRSDPHHILVANRSVDDEDGDVFKVNVHTGKAQRVARSSEKTFGFDADFRGHVRAKYKLDKDSKGTYVETLIRHPEGSWKTHFKSYVKDRNRVLVVGYDVDPDIVFINSNVDEDKSYIYEYNIKTRKKGETLFRHRFFDAAGVVVNTSKKATFAKYGEIVAVRYLGPKGRDFDTTRDIRRGGGDIKYFNPALKALHQKLVKQFKIKYRDLKIVDPATGQSTVINYPVDASIDITSITPDLKTVTFEVSGPRTPKAYYLLRNGKISLLQQEYPDIDPNALGQMELIYYKARDGLDIPAFLTKPNPALCGPGPWRAVVHPHGGPWARDTFEWDWSMWVPLMSSRCMAVLQPQYRGSAGWGRKLWMAGDKEWGQKMQDDKDDGAKWLIKNRIAIPGRVAMFGFSYGGYAAMAAAVRPHGNYRCAIAGAGVSDIVLIWNKFFTNDYFREAQGKTVKGLSPVDKADQIKIPIMVYHGDRDQIVPIEQSERYVKKARKSNQAVKYYAIKDYSHGRAWTRKIFGNQLRYIDDYFRAGCGGRGL